MGFNDAQWAYTVARAPMEAAVLAALCLRTDDETHQTFVGQDTIAQMLGAATSTVRRTLGVLERDGIITRVRRHGAGGYRTSDLITVNVTTYKAESLQGAEPTRQGAYKAERASLPLTEVTPTATSERAMIIQCDHSEDHSVNNQELELLIAPPTQKPEPAKAPDRFDEFYAVWPKKKDKPAASRAWAKAIKRASPEEIIAAATAYRDNPFITTKQFIPNPATWLNGDRWADELDGPRQHQNKPASDAKIANLLDRGRHLQALEARKELTS